MSKQEPIDAHAHLANEISVRRELEQASAAVGECARGPLGRIGGAGSGVDKNISLERQPGTSAQVNMLGQLKQVRANRRRSRGPRFGPLAR